VRTQLVDDLLTDLLQDVRFLRVYILAQIIQVRLYQDAEIKMITTCSKLVNNWEQAVRTHLVGKL
jgi:hypothetical protein